MSTEIAEIRQLLKELVISQKETDTKFKESRMELDQRFNETHKKIKEAFDLFTFAVGKANGESCGRIHYPHTE